jgi:hypothetical protein
VSMNHPIIPRETTYASDAENDKAQLRGAFAQCAEEDSNLHPVIPDQALTRSTARPYDTNPNAHGIVWTSHRADDGDAFVLWGTRLDPAAATIFEGPVTLTDPHGLALLAAACEQLDVLLPPERPAGGTGAAPAGGPSPCGLADPACPGNRLAGRRR